MSGLWGTVTNQYQYLYARIVLLMHLFITWVVHLYHLGYASITWAIPSHWVILTGTRSQILSAGHPLSLRGIHLYEPTFPCLLVYSPATYSFPIRRKPLHPIVIPRLPARYTCISALIYSYLLD